MRIRFWLSSIVTLAISADLSAQSWEILDEIDYARSLARYRLFDVASEYLDQLAAGESSEADRLALIYAGAELAKIAGGYAAGNQARLEFLQQATKDYEKFLEKADDDHDQYEAALAELAEANRELGALYVTMIEAGELDREETIPKAEKAFRKAAEEINKIFNRKSTEFRNVDPEAIGDPIEYERLRVEAYEPLLSLAATYYEFAHLYDPSQFSYEDYLSNCNEAAEEMLWEIDTTSFLAMKAYRYQGLALLGLDRADEGIAILEHVVSLDAGAPSILTLMKESGGIPAGAVDQVTRLVEGCYLALAEYYNAKGNYDQTEAVMASLDKYYQAFQEDGCKRLDTGDRCLLELGIARFRQGMPDGMALLEEVARRHQSDDIGDLAGRYIGEILEGGTGGEDRVIPPSVWMTAAQADASEGNPLDAIEKYHKAMAAGDTVSDEDEKHQLTVDSWNAIGRLYRGLRRYLEASIAYKLGLDYASRAGMDEEVKSLGIAWFNALTLRHKETRDRQDGRAKDEAMSYLGRIGIEDMRFLLARDDFEAARVLSPETEGERRKDALRDAESKFKQVRPNDANYERALIYLARIEAERGNFEEAVDRIENFFKRTEDKRNDPGLDRKKIQARESSLTEGTYYKALYLTQLESWEEVLNTLSSFEKEFSNQESFFPQVNYLRLRAYLGFDPPRLEEAEALYNEKKDGLLPLEAQFFMAKALLDKGQEVEAGSELARTYFSKGGEILYNYCQATGFDNFNLLRSAADAFLQIDNWAQAEEIYRKLLDVFGDDPEHQEVIQQSVKRTLAKVLLEQKKFQEAATFFKDLLAQGQADLNILKQAALCFGGWVAINDGRPEEVPGSGDYAKAVEIWDNIVDRAFPKEEKYTPPWYEAKFYSIYTRYRGKELNASYYDDAAKLMNNLDTTVLAFIPDEERTESLGGPEWERRYQYLKDQLR